MVVMSLIRQSEGWGKYYGIQDITFSNSTGTVSVLTVTGDVKVMILPVITTSLVPNTTANLRLGVVGNTDAMIVDGGVSTFAARGIWVDHTHTNEIESTERIRGYFIVDGNDVIMTLSAQINSGVIRFYYWWTPLSTDGKVENA
jgi:hypothetical protein